MAFHLYRLGLRTTALSSLLGITDQRYVGDFVQGRNALNERHVSDFARLVQVAPEELLRPLTADEAEAWRFYRISAAHHVTVWHRARDAWQVQGLSLSGAARVMGFSPTHVCLALQPHRRRRILALPPAARLADACALPTGAEHFITGLEDPNPCR
jgi:hypothetical protein